MYERAEKTEIAVRGGAEGFAGRGAVHVGDVGADGEMHGDWNAGEVGAREDACACESKFDGERDADCECAAEAFASDDDDGGERRG